MNDSWCLISLGWCLLKVGGWECLLLYCLLRIYAVCWGQSLQVWFSITWLYEMRVLLPRRPVFNGHIIFLFMTQTGFLRTVWEIWWPREAPYMLSCNSIMILNFFDWKCNWFIVLNDDTAQLFMRSICVDCGRDFPIWIIQYCLFWDNNFDIYKILFNIFFHSIFLPLFQKLPVWLPGRGRNVSAFHDNIVPWRKDFCSRWLF